MKQQIKRCPECGSLVRGTVKLSTTESFLQSAGEGAAKEVLDLVFNPAYIEVPTHNWWTGEDFMRKDIQWGWIGMAVLTLLMILPFIAKL